MIETASDWDNARESVITFAALEPELLGTGHSRAMEGPEMRRALHALAGNFDEVARPRHGRYAHEPAHADARGTIYVPPKK